MRPLKINSKKLAAALAALAVTGAVTAPAASASTPPNDDSPVATAPAQVGYSRGFHIYNYTSSPIVLNNITGSGNFEGRPADGSVLNPGSYHDIEVQYKWLDPQVDIAHYTSPDGGDGASVDMSVEDWGSPDVLDCSFPTGACAVNGTNVYLLDPPGTVNNLGPDQQQAQANVLNGLCNAGLASCTFTPTSEQHLLGDAVRAGDVSDNPYDSQRSKTIKAEDKRGESDSVEVELTAGVEEGVVAEVTATYGHEWTHEYTFGDEEEAEVPAHYSLWFCHTAPMIRDTGDFTVKLANTTWNLTGVYFDHPDLTKQAQPGHYFQVEQPMSDPRVAGSYCTYSAATPGVK